MNIILKLLLIIVFGSFTIYVGSSIANFFGISEQYYGFYLFFVIALIFLYFVLPNKNTNIFT